VFFIEILSHTTSKWPISAYFSKMSFGDGVKYVYFLDIFLTEQPLILTVIKLA